ncbi:hypothetical protein CEXT_447911, partial [Caerostris extrusa]
LRKAYLMGGTVSTSLKASRAFSANKVLMGVRLSLAGGTGFNTTRYDKEEKVSGFVHSPRNEATRYRKPLSESGPSGSSSLANGTSALHSGRDHIGHNAFRSIFSALCSHSERSYGLRDRPKPPS